MPNDYEIQIDGVLDPANGALLIESCVRYIRDGMRRGESPGDPGPALPEE